MKRYSLTYEGSVGDCLVGICLDMKAKGIADALSDGHALLSKMFPDTNVEEGILSIEELEDE